MASIAILAHRGSPDRPGGIVENTLEAFARARQLGADGVELDVRMTSDGGLAVHHDPVVDGAGPVAELKVADLPPWVPLLPAALEACAGLTVNIEIKNLPGEPGYDPGDQVARDVVELVVAAGRVPDVVVSSFWPDTLGVVRSAHPDLATGLLLTSWFDPGAGLALALDQGCTALHPHVDLVDRGAGGGGPPGRAVRGHLDGQRPRPTGGGCGGRGGHGDHRPRGPSGPRPDGRSDLPDPGF